MVKLLFPMKPLPCPDFRHIFDSLDGKHDVAGFPFLMPIDFE